MSLHQGSIQGIGSELDGLTRDEDPSGKKCGCHMGELTQGLNNVPHPAPRSATQAHHCRLLRRRASLLVPSLSYLA